MINYWHNISNVGNTLKTKEVIYMGLSDAEYMKRLRTELGKKLHGYPLTQTEMAKEVGYNSQDAISKIEQGRRQLSGPAKRCLALLAEKHDIEIE